MFRTFRGIIIMLNELGAGGATNVAATFNGVTLIVVSCAS